MPSLKPGDLVQVTDTKGAAPFLLVRTDEDGFAILRSLTGPTAGSQTHENWNDIYPWPLGDDLDAVQRGRVDGANALVDLTREEITEAAAAMVKEDPAAAPYLDRLLTETGCRPREKRYTATLSVSVTIEFGAKFDETTPALVENSLHISDDEDCIHITHDADLTDMTLAHRVTDISVQKLEEH